MIKRKGLWLMLCASLSAAPLLAQETKPLAFPGAEGFGKYTTGGRGGRTVIVSNLNDAGPGSLRAAINMKGPRTVVFTVSGTIALETKLSIKNGDLTIAGQTAPGDGICIKNHSTAVNADNVIIRYLRFRMGDERKDQDDAINGSNHQNIIIDHCSMSWSIDEAASFYYNKDFTLQWCLIAESMENSFHEKGPHGYGGIWGGRGASFHHNLLANHTSRNPRFSGSASVPNPPDELVDFTNNVIFNWSVNSTYGGEKGKYNMVNNYYKPGPATVKTRNRILNPYPELGKFYLSGNVLVGNDKITKDNWLGVVGEKNAPVDAARVDKPFTVECIQIQSAAEAYKQVLLKAGASFKRDAVDSRIVKDVQTGMANEGKDHNGIIDSQNDVGGWPELKQLPAPADADSDGMPDDWEKKHGLNPAEAADATIYKLDKQYTNLEVYINGLVK